MYYLDHCCHSYCQVRPTQTEFDCPIRRNLPEQLTRLLTSKLDMTTLAVVTRTLLFFATCLVVKGSADDATSIVMVESEPYVQLDAEKHLAALDDPDIWLVEFFSPMCGSCAEFKSTWMEVASALHGQVRILNFSGLSNLQGA